MDYDMLQAREGAGSNCGQDKLQDLQHTVRTQTLHPEFLHLCFYSTGVPRSPEEGWELVHSNHRVLFCAWPTTCSRTNSLAGFCPSPHTLLRIHHKYAAEYILIHS